MSLPNRMDRIAGMIQKELGELIDQRLQNPKIPPFVTVHSVKVAKDLSNAEVRVTFLQDETPEAIEEIIGELQKAARFLRSELSHRIRLKYMPELRFHYNPSTHYAAELEKIFKKIEPETRPADG